MRHFIYNNASSFFPDTTIRKQYYKSWENGGQLIISGHHCLVASPFYSLCFKDSNTTVASFLYLFIYPDNYLIFICDTFMSITSVGVCNKIHLCIDDMIWMFKSDKNKRENRWWGNLNITLTHSLCIIAVLPYCFRILYYKVCHHSLFDLQHVIIVVKWVDISKYFFQDSTYKMVLQSITTYDVIQYYKFNLNI